MNFYINLISADIQSTYMSIFHYGLISTALSIGEKILQAYTVLNCLMNIHEMEFSVPG